MDDHGIFYDLPDILSPTRFSPRVSSVLSTYSFRERKGRKKVGRYIFGDRPRAMIESVSWIIRNLPDRSSSPKERNRKNIGLKRRDMVRRRGRKEREKGERGVNWWNERSRRAVICSRCFFAFRSTSSLSRATYVVAVRAKNKYSFSFFSFFFFPFFFF